MALTHSMWFGDLQGPVPWVCTPSTQSLSLLYLQCFLSCSTWLPFPVIFPLGWELVSPKGSILCICIFLIFLRAQSSKTLFDFIPCSWAEYFALTWSLWEFFPILLQSQILQQGSAQRMFLIWDLFGWVSASCWLCWLSLFTFCCFCRSGLHFV